VAFSPINVTREIDPVDDHAGRSHRVRGAWSAGALR